MFITFKEIMFEAVAYDNVAFANLSPHLRLKGSQCTHTPVYGNDTSEVTMHVYAVYGNDRHQRPQCTHAWE